MSIVGPKLEDNLSFLGKLEDNLNFFGKMEDDLKFNENGRQLQFLSW